MTDNGKESFSETVEEVPEFKVIINEQDDSSSDDTGDSDDVNENDNLSTMLTSDTEESEVLVPNGYPVLELRHVNLASRSKNPSKMLLDDVNMQFRIRRTHYVQSSSPEKVSTLVAVMSGFVSPDEGSVLYRGTDLHQIETWDYRGHQLGVIFSHNALRTDLSALDNLIYTMEASGRTFLKPKEVRAHAILEEMDFPERLAKKPVREIHSLDYMRAAIARAVCCECDVLLAQEPMSQLTENESQVISDLLNKTAKHHDCAVIIASSQKMQENPFAQTFVLE
jgi:putative ABC transport system ATP-binding protein